MRKGCSEQQGDVSSSSDSIQVRTTRASRLRAALAAEGGEVRPPRAVATGPQVHAVSSATKDKDLVPTAIARDRLGEARRRSVGKEVGIFHVILEEIVTDSLTV